MKFYNRIIIECRCLRGESHINFRTQCIIMMQTRLPPTPCQIRHFQNFDKIDSFDKIDILILGNLIVGWGEGVIKEGTGILHQNYGLKGVLIVWGK